MKGCLFIHGFTGSPYEIQPLAEYLRENTDWMISTPTLAGHGEQDSLKETSWKDWIASAEEECEKLMAICPEVVVIGFSMGGLIAAHLASTYNISKLILLSPALYTVNQPLLLKEMREMIKHRFQYDQAQSSINMSEQLVKYKKKVRQTPLRAVIQFRKLVKQVRPVFEKIDVPVLIIQGERDFLVKPKSAYYIYDQVQTEEKEILFLKESKHIVCRDCESDIIFQKVNEFLQDEKAIN